MSHEPNPLSIAESLRKEVERKLEECEAKLKRSEHQLSLCRGRLNSANEENLRLSASNEDLTRDVKTWRYQAEHDTLTDLYRRGVFARKVSNILHGRREDEVPGSCLALLDIDKFKDINDNFGHPTGDEVLRGVAQIIASEIRADDLACRIGDEFLIFFNGASQDSAERVTRRIADKVKTLRFGKESVGKDVRTSISYGVVLRSEQLTTYEELYHDADLLMYAMKKKRKEINA